MQGVAPGVQGVDSGVQGVDPMNYTVQSNGAGHTQGVMQPACRLHAGCITFVYERMQAAYNRMQPAYDRMQPACRLHYALVWPRHKASLVVGPDPVCACSVCL